MSRDLFFFWDCDQAVAICGILHGAILPLIPRCLSENIYSDLPLPKSCDSQTLSAATAVPFGFSFKNLFIYTQNTCRHTNQVTLNFIAETWKMHLTIGLILLLTIGAMPKDAVVEAAGESFSFEFHLFGRISCLRQLYINVIKSKVCVYINIGLDHLWILFCYKSLWSSYIYLICDLQGKNVYK